MNPLVEPSDSTYLQGNYNCTNIPVIPLVTCGRLNVIDIPSSVTLYSADIMQTKERDVNGPNIAGNVTGNERSKHSTWELQALSAAKTVGLGQRRISKYNTNPLYNMLERFNITLLLHSIGCSSLLVGPKKVLRFPTAHIQHQFPCL